MSDAARLQWTANRDLVHVVCSFIRNPETLLLLTDVSRTFRKTIVKRRRHLFSHVLFEVNTWSDPPFQEMKFYAYTFPSDITILLSNAKDVSDGDPGWEPMKDISTLIRQHANLLLGVVTVAVRPEYFEFCCNPIISRFVSEAFVLRLGYDPEAFLGEINIPDDASYYNRYYRARREPIRVFPDLPLVMNCEVLDIHHAILCHLDEQMFPKVQNIHLNSFSEDAHYYEEIRWSCDKMTEVDLIVSHEEGRFPTKMLKNISNLQYLHLEGDGGLYNLADLDSVVSPPELPYAMQIDLDDTFLHQYDFTRARESLRWLSLSYDGRVTEPDWFDFFRSLWWSDWVCVLTGEWPMLEQLSVSFTIERPCHLMHLLTVAQTPLSLFDVEKIVSVSKEFFVIFEINLVVECGRHCKQCDENFAKEEVENKVTKALVEHLNRLGNVKRGRVLTKCRVSQRWW